MWYLEPRNFFDAGKVVLVDSVLYQAHGRRCSPHCAATTTATSTARRLSNVANGGANRQSRTQILNVTGVCWRLLHQTPSSIPAVLSHHRHIEQVHRHSAIPSTSPVNHVDYILMLNYFQRPLSNTMISYALHKIILIRRRKSHSVADAVVASTAYIEI